MNKRNLEKKGKYHRKHKAKTIEVTTCIYYIETKTVKKLGADGRQSTTSTGLKINEAKTKCMMIGVQLDLPRADGNMRTENIKKNF